MTAEELIPCSRCGTAHTIPPPFECDPVAQHFGFVNGVPRCPVGVVCRHGWVLSQKAVDNLAPQQFDGWGVGGESDHESVDPSAPAQSDGSSDGTP